MRRAIVRVIASIDKFMQWLVIALGGALGSVLRYGLSGVLLPSLGWKVPYGTWAVNVVGCFLIGVLYTFFVLRVEDSALVKLFFCTGLLGGFTTFSAFSLEVIQLWQQGSVLLAVAYASGSVILGLFAAWAGIALSQHYFS
jgi:CrcB protein